MDLNCCITNVLNRTTETVDQPNVPVPCIINNFDQCFVFSKVFSFFFFLLSSTDKTNKQNLLYFKFWGKGNFNETFVLVVLFLWFVNSITVYENNFVFIWNFLQKYNLENAECVLICRQLIYRPPKVQGGKLKLKCALDAILASNSCDATLSDF